MPRRPQLAGKPPRIPGYCLHKPTGQAFLRAGGRTVYLGVYGSPESRDAYAEAVAAILAERELPAPARNRRAPSRPSDCLTVAEVCRRYTRHAQGYYVKRGKKTSEAGMVTTACDHAAALFGDLPAEAFGPVALKAVRERMVAAGLARGTVNGHVGRIHRAFKWAAGEELIPATVATALAMVPGLRAGRTTARETAPVLPVEDALVEATLPHLPEVVADMVRLQRLEAMRPGEVCIIRPCDLDRSGDVWHYLPESHKTEHHGLGRIIGIGPLGQAVLLRYLARDPEAFCFRPCDSEAKRRAERHANRKTPLSCGNVPGSQLAASPLTQPGECYTTASYGRAITRACDKAGLERWSPNKLRHRAATETRELLGLDATQARLGHATARMSEHYAKTKLETIDAVARAIS